MILYLCTHLLLFRSGNCKGAYEYFFHTHMCMNHTQLYTLYHLPSMGDFIYVFITRFLYFVACHCLFSKALDQKPEFVLKDLFYAVSFIMAWIFTQIASIMRLVCCYIPIGLCILSMSCSLLCSPHHAVVGVACAYLLILYWDCIAIPTTLVWVVSPALTVAHQGIYSVISVK
jgi:hypothetical protein